MTLAALARRELIVVTGKGGVGKSAVAAALGSLLAGTGRRTLLLEIDPRESLHAWLEVPPSGGELLAVGPRLFLQHLDPRQEMDDLVDHHLRIGPLVRRVLASPVYAHFADGAPGLKELAVLGHALRLVDGPPIKGAPPLDVVVLDAPASGHGVTLLTAPSLAAEVIRQGPFGRMAARLSSPRRRRGTLRHRRRHPGRGDAGAGGARAAGHARREARPGRRPARRERAVPALSGVARRRGRAPRARTLADAAAGQRRASSPACASAGAAT